MSTYLAHHELESVTIVITIVITTIVVVVVVVVQMGSIPGSTVREAPVGVTVPQETLCCCPNLQPYLQTQTRHQRPVLGGKWFFVL